MSVNADYLYHRIAEINDAIEAIQKITSRRYSELRTEDKLALRYLIIQLVEAAASICVHILTQKYGEKPQGYPHCFIRLAEKGLISPELGDRLAAAARLRNILVHRYWTIDDEKIYESAKQGTKNFTTFAKAIGKLAGRSPSS